MRLRLISGLLLSLFCLLAFAAAPGGTIIRNQASATYTDSNGISKSTTSNIVETIIRNVPGFELSHDQQQSAAAGTLVNFSHVLTNTGNMPDSYDLVVGNVLQGDSFDFGTLELYADTDQDGLADSAVELTTSPVLAVGQSFHFLVVAGMPVSLVDGQQAQLIVEAVSSASGTAGNALLASNTDTVVVSQQAVVTVSKSLSSLQGSSPSGPYRVTLVYSNNSSSAVDELLLIDSLPAGMSYVADSARWSEIPGAVLTDFDGSDPQMAGVSSIRWCAYDNSCTALPVAQTGAGGNASSSVNQATALIDNIAANASASVWFDVTIDAGLDPGQLLNTPEFATADTTAANSRQLGNTVVFTVNGYEGVVANGSQVDPADGADEPVTSTSVSQAGVASFDNFIWNTGNLVDTFDIEIDETQSTFPASTVFRLFHADGVTPLLDSNGNGVPDTGPMSPGTVYPVVMKANLPAGLSGDNQGNGFAITKLARSSLQPTLFNPVIDFLPSIIPQSVDLTNIAAVTDPAALGGGPGPQAQPLQTLDAAPGSVVEFTLYVNNTGNEPDTYGLSVSGNSVDPSQPLPANWQVTFLDESANVITQTSPLPAGSSQRLTARVQVPANAAEQVQSLYFRAQSPVTLVADVKHDAVAVVANVALSLEPDQSGQAIPGMFKIYSHLLANTGTASLTNIALSIEDSLASQGWSSALYADSNTNGQLDADDQLIAIVPQLSVGQSMVLFAKVFVPSNAPVTAINSTVVTAFEPVQNITRQARDLTGVSNGLVSILKQQAPDLGCDLLADGVYSVHSFDIEPGSNCILYRLTATNNGPVDSLNVVIHDSTPGHTRFQPGATCSSAQCTLETPAAGSTGYVRASVPQLLPGASFTLEFAVMVE